MEVSTRALADSNEVCDGGRKRKGAKKKEEEEKEEEEEDDDDDEDDSTHTHTPNSKNLLMNAHTRATASNFLMNGKRRMLFTSLSFDSSHRPAPLTPPYCSR